MRKRCILLLFLVAAVATTVLPQSNALVDRLLRQDIALFGETCYLILTAGGLVSESATVDECLAILSEQRWGLKEKQNDDLVTIGELSYLIMRSLDVSGGLMYSLFPSPRYAFKELAFRGLITEGTGPYRSVSGNEVVHTLGNVMEWKEMYQ